jgi:hypothetical protein
MGGFFFIALSSDIYRTEIGHYDFVSDKIGQKSDIYSRLLRVTLPYFAKRKISLNP